MLALVDLINYNQFNLIIIVISVVYMESNTELDAFHGFSHLIPIVTWSG